MRFVLEEVPPTVDAIARERDRLRAEMRQLRRRDALLTSLLIIAFSIIAGLATFWATDNLRYASITAALFPAVGAVLAATGLITAAGFRSAARRLIELNHEVTALMPVSGPNRQEMDKLARKYALVQTYVDQVDASGRDLVNGELALFWEWDASTEAKQDRGRDFVDKARESILS